MKSFNQIRLGEDIIPASSNAGPNGSSPGGEMFRAQHIPMSWKARQRIKNASIRMSNGGKLPPKRDSRGYYPSDYKAKLREDGVVANCTGSPGSGVMSMPSFPLKQRNGQDITIRRRMKVVDVPSECFAKFGTGRIKLEQFFATLDDGDPAQRALRECISGDRDACMILRDATSGMRRAIQRR
jgi:hypothetical protein